MFALLISIMLSSSNEYHQDCKFSISWVDQGFNQGLVAYKRQGSETVDRDYSCHSLSWLLLIPPQPVVVQCETTAHCFATAKLPIPLLNYQCHWHPAQSTVKQLNTLKPSWVQKQDLIISLVVFPPFANSWAWSWSTEGSIFLCKCRSDLYCQACQNSSLQWLCICWGQWWKPIRCRVSQNQRVYYWVCIKSAWARNGIFASVV